MRVGARRVVIGALVCVALVVLGGGGWRIAARSSEDPPPAHAREVRSADPREAGTPRLTATSATTAASAPTIEVRDDAIWIDFARCAPGRRRIDVAFGSTTVAILGREGEWCRMQFGGEVENPNWDGRLDRECRIPARLGRVGFARGSLGVALDPLHSYCARR